SHIEITDDSDAEDVTNAVAPQADDGIIATPKAPRRKTVVNRIDSDESRLVQTMEIDTGPLSPYFDQQPYETNQHTTGSSSVTPERHAPKATGPLPRGDVRRQIIEFVGLQEDKWRDTVLPRLIPRQYGIAVSQLPLLSDMRLELTYLNEERVPKLVDTIVDAAPRSHDALRVLCEGIRETTYLRLELEWKIARCEDLLAGRLPEDHVTTATSGPKRKARADNHAFAPNDTMSDFLASDDDLAEVAPRRLINRNQSPAPSDYGDDDHTNSVSWDPHNPAGGFERRTDRRAGGVTKENRAVSEKEQGAKNRGRRLSVDTDEATVSHKRTRTNAQETGSSALNAKVDAALEAFAS
ncbi:hypothetical protein HK405_001397, partial [Cladochytrium tenue]